MNNILEMLNENNTQEIQQKAVELAKEIDDISIFFDYSIPSTLWKNCAKVISRKTDEELKPYIKNMLEWIEDINRPGAFRIYFRLKDMDVNYLYNDYVEYIETTIKKNDESALEFLSGLIEKEEIKNKLPIDLYNILKKYNDVFWKNNSEIYRKWMNDNNL